MVPERLQSVLDVSRPVADRLAAGGHRVYLVGGIVRDLLLGRSLAGGDIDLTTDAVPERLRALLGPDAEAMWTQGERFGTIGVRYGGQDFEVTTHRAEAYHPDSRKPKVRFAEAVDADLSRRDFTVNAMALELPEPRLVDPFDGAADLAAGRLRTPLSPTESFTDDPLRMLRAARFIAGYGLVPTPDLLDAVRSLRDRLGIVSAERIRDEFDKLMVTNDPSSGLWFLVDTGLLDEFLPELPAMRLEQDPIHRHKDVLAHTIAVVDGVASHQPDGTPRVTLVPTHAFEIVESLAAQTAVARGLIEAREPPPAPMDVLVQHLATRVLGQPLDSEALLEFLRSWQGGLSS